MESSDFGSFLGSLSNGLVQELNEVLPKLGGCPQDPLPALFPVQSFDLTYRRLFQRKADDLLSLVVEGGPSLLKILFFGNANPKNNLNAFLY